MSKDTFKVIGDFTWQEARNAMVMKLAEIKTEKEFVDFMKRMLMSMGTLEDIKKARKKLHLKPLTKEEMEAMKK